MARRANLRGVAHNVAHSFLSLGIHFVDNSWAIQHLLMAARSGNVTSVKIDLVTGEISPKSILTATLVKCGRYLSEQFCEMVVTSGSSRDFVASAELRVDFDFTAPPGVIAPSHWFSPSIIMPEAVVYSGHTTIIDDRGSEYSATVNEWWRE